MTDQNTEWETSQHGGFIPDLFYDLFFSLLLCSRIACLVLTPCMLNTQKSFLNTICQNISATGLSNTKFSSLICSLPTRGRTVAQLPCDLQHSLVKMACHPQHLVAALTRSYLSQAGSCHPVVTAQQPWFRHLEAPEVQSHPDTGLDGRITRHVTFWAL